jgi:hypothetical protein
LVEQKWKGGPQHDDDAELYIEDRAYAVAVEVEREWIWRTRDRGVRGGVEAGENPDDDAHHVRDVGDAVVVDVAHHLVFAQRRATPCRGRCRGHQGDKTGRENR